MSFDFSALPPVSFATYDAAKLERSVLTTFERIQGRSLYPGDPDRLFLEGLAYWGAVFSSLVDEAGRQSLLAFATGAHLDHLGAYMHTPRLGAASARCTLRFSLSAPLSFAVTVPMGTRAATKDGGVRFATQASVTIPPGSLSADADAVATTPGTTGNGLVAGQVSTLVDPVAGVASVANTSLSLGGADIESDDHYRMRIQLAPERFSCAGSEGAYRYHVLSVHRDIVDAAIWCPEPGTVDIRPVLDGGELPSPELIEAVMRAVSADTVRPLTDTVTVAAPSGVPFSIRGGWYLAKRDEALASTITAAVSMSVEKYRTWQRSTVGLDINPDELVSLVKKAGAKRLELSEPVFTALEPWQIARDGEIVFPCLGVEDV